MKNLFFLFPICFYSIGLFGQVTIPTSGNTTITTCNQTVYDMGGSSGGLSPGADGSITIYPASSGNVVAVFVEELNIDWYNDYLYIYNGTSTSAPLITTLQGGWGSSNYIDHREYYGNNANGAITIRFKTGPYANSGNKGFKIRVECAPTSQPHNMVQNKKRIITTCGTTIYDHGGIYGDYQNNSKDTLVILPNAPGKKIQINFKHFALYNIDGMDQVYYLGGLEDSPNSILFANSGYSLPNSGAPLYSRSSDGSVSIILSSDANYTAQGFRATIGCVNATTTAPSEAVVPSTGTATINTCNTVVYDNGFKYDYSPNSNGSLTIVPATDEKKVKIEFSEFNVSEGDVLTIFDGTTTSATLLGTFTGSTLPPSVTATTANASGALTIRFVSNGSGEAAGFKFSTSCVDPLPETLIPTTGSITLTSCNRTILDAGGSVGAYANNSNGSLLITPATSGKMVKLHFTSFDTQLNADILSVYDGTDENAPLIGSYSGTTIPSDIVASNTSGQLFLKFVSDASVTAGGFTILSSCVDPEYKIPNIGSSALTTCEATLYDAGGSTAEYKNNADGILTIYPGAANKLIKLTFSAFSVMAGDTLYIYEGDNMGTLIAKYSGTVLPPAIIASNNNTSGSLTLRFTSDADGVSSGFAASISCINTESYIPVSGNSVIYTCGNTVYDSGGPNGNYSEYADGSITIYPSTENRNIRITFTHFDLESNYDYLFVYDGTSVDENKLIGQYSGNTLPPTLSAFNSSGALTIRLKSDYSVNKSGVVFTVSCFKPETIIPPTGNISITTCSATVYDSGGSDGNYSEYEDGSITIYPATENRNIRITFTQFDLEEDYDYLFVYDGTSVDDNKLIGQYSGNTLPPSLSAFNSSGALTIRLKSDYSINNSGVAFTVSCFEPETVVPPKGNLSITTCSTTVYDSGGSLDNYLNNQDGSLTLIPGTEGGKIKAEFESFNTEEGFDFLYVYDGTSTSDSLIGIYDGTILPPPLQASDANTSGALTIRFTSDNSFVRSGFAINISCIVPVSSVSVSHSTATLPIDSTLQLSANVFPVNATNKNVTWSTSDNSIVSVSSSGLVTGVGVGMATITVTTEDGNYTSTATVTVNPIAVTSVTVSPSTAIILINETTQLTATVSPSNAANTKVFWLSSDESIATVSSSGLVTGVGVGMATITATTEDGNYTSTATVTVNPIAVTSVTVSPSTAIILINETTQLTATVSPSNATNTKVFWLSSDESIATVSSSGLVTGVGVGTATITA
ncbi:MAG TPA: CUB domain-containing protein, partial [Cytophagaceae bacterium]